MGGIMGGIGSMVGASMQADAARDAANINAAAADRAGERALTGYKYLTSGAGAAPMQNYINAGQVALGKQTGVQDAMMELLGLGGGSGGSSNGSATGTAATGTSTVPFVASSGGAPVNMAISMADPNRSQTMAANYIASQQHSPAFGTVADANGMITGPDGTRVYPSAYSDYQPTTDNAPMAAVQQNIGTRVVDNPNAPAALDTYMQNNGGTVNTGVPGSGGSMSTGSANGGANSAFQNYLNSTGYQFRMGQGMDTITGNQAVNGALNSGATLRALTKYGQNLGSAEFQNYLNQLGNMNNILGATAAAGQSGLGQIATVGTSGGGQAANAIMQGASNQGAAIMQGGNAMANGIAGLSGAIGNSLGNMQGGGGWW